MSHGTYLIGLARTATESIRSQKQRLLCTGSGDGVGVSRWDGEVEDSQSM